MKPAVREGQTDVTLILNAIKSHAPSLLFVHEQPAVAGVPGFELVDIDQPIIVELECDFARAPAPDLSPYDGRQVGLPDVLDLPVDPFADCRIFTLDTLDELVALLVANLCGCERSFRMRRLSLTLGP